MLEYPEIKTIVSQMQIELIGKTIESGKLIKKNNNMFMGDNDELLRYNYLKGGKVIQIECLAPDFYIKLDNGYGIIICQSGGRILYNKSPSDIPKNYNIIYNFTDDSNLTYTVSLFTLGIYAITHDEWQDRIINNRMFDPLNGGSFDDYLNFIKKCNDQEKLAIKIFLSKNMNGIMSTYAAEILLYAKIYPSTQLKKLNTEEHKRIYESMKRVINSACEKGGRISEYNLYGQKGSYVAMAERKHIGDNCPICGGLLEKNSTGGVTAFCPMCQVKR